ncbi:unnamed protein product [Candidula unifasciata]|uniref:Nucleolar protein 11 C-terminal domain-containing protein n=1 Tax=Candidula unifasciata TaxID=100452 RepID=A0A8S3YJD7_9EUPU|nr:unnamed protein product [Candidula unifasciata]
MAVNDRQIVDKFIEDGDFERLLQLPETLDDFTESSIVKCVVYFLKSSDEVLEAATKHVPETEISTHVPWVKESMQSPFTDKRCYVLNVMLCQKFSPHFLQEEARLMPFDCVLSLAKYFHFLLSWVPTDPDCDSHVPSLEQIIDWLNALLDGHFQQLKLAEDSTAVIESLQEQVTLMTKWQIESKALQGTLLELNRLFEKQQQQRSTKMGDYCIEVISF